MAFYIDYNNKTPKGNVTAGDFKDCIEVNDWQLGVGRSISMEAGAMANREASKPSLSELSFSKKMDAASAGLFKDALAVKDGVTLILYVVQTGNDTIEKYAEYKFEDCIISSYGVAGTPGSAPVEHISVSYSKIEADLTHADKTNKNTQNMKVGYDLAEGKPL